MLKAKGQFKRSSSAYRTVPPTTNPPVTFPERETPSTSSPELVLIRGMLERLLGPEGRRRMALRDKPNPELFALYDNELALHLHNDKNLTTARRLLDNFQASLGDSPPSEEAAKAFLAGFARLKSSTRAWYNQTIAAFMKWYGVPLEGIRVRIPRTLPPYVEDAEVEKLLAMIGNKKTHKGDIPRDLLLIKLLWRTGLLQ